MNFLWHFAGLWPLVWKMGATGITIGALVLLAFFTPAWLVPVFSRKIALWAAAALAYGFITYSVGVLDEAHRKDAQQSAGLQAETKIGERFRSDAERAVRAEPPDSVRNDPHNRDARDADPRKK